jgi:hypothetical protein
MQNASVYRTLAEVKADKAKEIYDKSMVKAKEIYDESMVKALILADKHYNKLIKLIEKAAVKGEFSIVYKPVSFIADHFVDRTRLYAIVANQLKTRLVEDGFDVQVIEYVSLSMFHSFNDNRRYPTLEIRWEYSKTSNEDSYDDFPCGGK